MSPISKRSVGLILSELVLVLVAVPVGAPFKFTLVAVLL